MPLARGFEHSFGHMGGCIDNWSHFFYWAGPNVHDLWRDGVEVHEEGRFFPDLMVEEAGKFMTESRDKRSPFFLYWQAPSVQRRGRPW
jgi:arylsulfatase A